MSADCHPPAVDPVRVGRSVRALRQRLRWRQVDLAQRAGVAQQTVSDIERGRSMTVALSRVIRVAAALDADIDLVVRWRAGALDRLLDERHAALSAATAERLQSLGYAVVAEASYSYFGERGSVDVLGFMALRSAIVVVEVKTELTSIEATLRKHDEKIRLGPRIARDRFGWTPRVVIGLLVVSDDSTSRRRAERHAVVLGAAYPNRGRAAWAVAAAANSPARGLVRVRRSRP